MFSYVIESTLLVVILFGWGGNAAKLGPPVRFQFEFSHEEQLSIGGDDDVEEHEQYDDGGTLVGDHVRRKRSAQWAPDYDLYGQWAEEYYANYEGATEGEVEAEERKEEPKKDILDVFLNVQENETETMTKRPARREFHTEMGKYLLMFITLLIGSLILFKVVGGIVTKVMGVVCCDFCDSMNYKKKAQKLVNEFVPGVHIYPDGSKEFYIPTEEEMEALEDAKKLLWGLRMH